MRKQYHFWPGETGTDAWDVDRLIELASDLPRKRIPLSSIGEIDSVYWFDDAQEQPTVRKIVEHVHLIDEVDLAHPIILGVDGRVMDGMHRIAKALLLGDSHILAVRLADHPEPDHRDCDPSQLPYGR